MQRALSHAMILILTNRATSAVKLVLGAYNSLCQGNMCPLMNVVVRKMAGKSIAGDNVPSCIQSGIHMSENWLSLTMTRGLAML